MPRFNGAGPRGTGPLTGRGMGYCAVHVSAPVRGYTPSPYRSAPIQNRYPYPRFFSGGRRGRGMGARGGRGHRGRW